MKILLTLLLLTSSIFPNYNDFNQAFINVAQNQSETMQPGGWISKPVLVISPSHTT